MCLVSQGRDDQLCGCRAGILLLAGDEAAVAYREGFEAATLDVVGTTLFGRILDVPGHHFLPDVVIRILLLYIRETGHSLARDEIGAIWIYVKRLLTELGQRKRQSSDQSREDVSHVETEQGVIQLLSKREVDILCRIAHGLSNQAIADEMVVELSTVKSHLKHIYRKLNVESRTQAVALARKLDLL